MKTATTPRFELAGKLPDRTVLLEASAGTGKTYTIAHLVVRYIAERGIDISELLVVTFTDAATMELRERIRKRIREAIDALRGEACEDAVLEAWAKASAGAERELHRHRLEEALANIDAAAISTIHGFCGRVLKEAAFESGADYSAELIGDTGSLYRDLVFDHWATWLSKLPEAHYDLVKSRLSAKSLSALLMELVRNPKARLLPAEVPDVTALDEERVRGRRALREAWHRDGAGIGAGFERDFANKAFRYSVGNAGFMAHAFRVLERVVATDACASKEDLEILSRLLPDTIAKGTRETKGNKHSQLHEEPLFELVESHIAQERRFSNALVSSIERGLADRIRNELPYRKRKLGVLTFDDLLGLVASSLANEDAPLRSHLRARYRVALIDEFQDTDPIQWAIFRAIFHEGGLPLLLIGDPKQAIYSFRGADIEVYLKARDEAHARFRLETNHRSDGPLVEAVNDVFSRFDASLGDARRLRYEPVSAAHQEPRLRLGGEPLSALRIFPSAIESTTKLPNVSDMPATWAAWEILGFLQSGAEIYDEKKKAHRKVSPRDCAVLVSKNWRAKQVREALSSLLVPSVLRTDESVLQSAEAEQLGIWLRALADPTSLSRLVGLMATPLFGATAEEIDRVRSEEGELEQKIRLVDDWARLFNRYGLMRALRATVAHLDIEPRLAKQGGGERRLTDLWHTAELLHAVRVDEGLDAEGLSLYLERERSQDDKSDERRKLRLETDADAVEIVTIHRSKGLEYPAVFCPDLYEEGSLRAPLRYTERSERILDLQPSEEAKEMARQDQLNERLRLAYVALTRARHLTSVLWAKPSSKRSDRRSALDWLFFGDEPVESWKAIEDPFDHIASTYPNGRGRILVASRGFEPKSPRYERPLDEQIELHAEEYGREEPLDTRFRWSSYSSITAGKGREASERFGSDEDAEREAVLSHSEGSGAGEEAHLADFKHGTQLGNLLHEVLETVDFAAAEDLEGEVEARLDHYGLRTRLDAHPTLVTDLAEMLREALETPLVAGPGAFRLADIAKGDRLNELRFAFPMGEKGDGFRGEMHFDELKEALSRHPRPALPSEYREDLDRLKASGLRGLMHGSIDLVFRREGRFYLVDYKSNHLGESLEDYRQEKLMREMREKHYLLQAQIYSLALHRFLGQRLRDYDPDEHFGGVLYLFLRGMKRETGARFGVYFDEPPREAILDLDRVFTKLGGAR